MQPTKINATEIFDISESVSSGNLIAFNITQSKDILLAVAKRELDYRDESGCFAKVKTENGQDYRIFYSAGENLIHLTDIENEFFNIHNIQLFDDGRILLVCGRSQYRTETDFDKNGRIYSQTGEFLSDLLLGDGIQDVQVTNDGAIWTSFFDEGIFGNYGWSDPVGSSGLIAWKSSGEKIFEYYPKHGLDSMCDCYAMNVESNHVTWCYYYTEFPLVKIKDGVIADYWNMPVHGSSVFAIYQDFGLFQGGYDDCSFFYLVKLGREHVAEIKAKFTIDNVAQVERVCARGDALFFLSDKKIYKISVCECL